MKTLYLASTALAAIVAVGPSNAADMPLKAPRNAVMAESWDAYFWLDGSYQRVNLPTYNLGPATTVGAAQTYGAPFLGIDPSTNGFGVSGGVGYFLPPGTLAGLNGRLEIGGSYVRTTGTQTASTGAYTLASGAAIQMLDGRFSVSYGCVGVCNSTSTVSTTYDRWQINSKVATDFKTEAVTLTPSLAIFGGTSRNNQTLAHLTNNGFSPSSIFYNADTDLRWVDWGARLGVDATTDLTRKFSVGIGGSLGLAARHTSLSGSDVSGTTSVGTRATSNVDVGANKTAFLANAEANVAYRPTQDVTLKAFVGLNYDNSVPGILAPSYSGPLVILSSPTTAASINYQAETSYYAGGGLSVKF